MKIGLIGDTHHGMRNGSHIWRSYQKDMILNYIIPLFKEKQITELIDLGDWFDNRRSVLAIDWKWMKEELIPLLAENGMTLHMVVGNHTIALRDSVEVNHCEILEQLSIAHGSHCVKAYTNPTEVTFGKTKTIILPWIAHSNYNQVVSAIEETDAAVVLSHLELKGFLLTKGKLLDHGTIKTSYFEKFIKCLSGHLHIGSEQRLRSGTLVKFLGIPYEQSWSDYDSGVANGVYIMDCNDTSLEFIPTPKDRSMFLELTYSYQDISSARKGKLWQDTDYLADTLGLRDKVVRIVVTDRSNQAHYAKFLKALRSVPCVNYQIVDTTKVVELEVEEVSAKDFSISPLEILLDKVEEIEYTDYDEDKEVRYEAISDKLKSVYSKCQDENNLV